MKNFKICHWLSENFQIYCILDFKFSIKKKTKQTTNKITPHDTIKTYVVELFFFQ